MCLDRSGLVGNDGPTHHGLFDLSYLPVVPNLTVAVPKDGNELRAMLHYTAEHKLDGPVAVRYPRAAIPEPMRDAVDPIEWGKWEYITPLNDVVLLAVGTMVDQAAHAVAQLGDAAKNVSIVNARFVKPWDMDMLEKIAGHARVIIVVEENSQRGGFGEAIGNYLMESAYGGHFKALAIPDRFVTHGDRSDLLKEVGLDVDSIAEVITSVSVQPPRSGILGKLGLKRQGKHGHRGKKETDDTVGHLFGESK